MNASDLTPSQRGALVSFVSRSRQEAREALYRGLSKKEFGYAGMLEKLARKGVIEVEREEIGPRGGKTIYYRPTSEGYRLADYISINGLKTW